MHLGQVRFRSPLVTHREWRRLVPTRLAGGRSFKAWNSDRGNVGCAALLRLAALKEVERAAEPFERIAENVDVERADSPRAGVH